MRDLITGLFVAAGALFLLFYLVTDVRDVDRAVNRMLDSVAVSL